MVFEVRAALLCRCDFTQAVSEKTQRPLGRDGRVKLPNRARSGVARVDESFFASRAFGDLVPLAFVERFEIVAAHIDLAPDLKNRRNRWPQRRRAGPPQARHGPLGGQRSTRSGKRGGKLQGDLPNGANVLCDVFAGFTIAARGRLHQHALLVTQAHGQAVKFGFGHVVNGGGVLGQPQFAAHTAVKIHCATGFGVGLGADAEHRHGVTHCDELV